MPTLHLTAQGKICGLWGHTIIKGADSHAHPLKLGDIVRCGDVILTTQDGIVELTSDGSAAPVVAGTAVDAVTATVPVTTPATASASRGEIDQVIEKLAQNDAATAAAAAAAAAAGLAGGDGGEFLPGLRVERISESLTPPGVGNGEDTAPGRTAVAAGANPLAAARANTVALPASIGLDNALTITPHEGKLANYLHFSAVGGNTVVEISSTGSFSSSYKPAAVDQVITLTGLNLVGSFSNEHPVINDLLQRGKLVTD